MDKKSETISIRVTADEKQVVKILSEQEQRSVSDSLHRILFAHGACKDLKGLPSKHEDRRAS